jgi:hypothetical protein
MADVNVMCLLESMKKQHAQYCQQRDQAQANLQQLVGAIYALESIIKSHEDIMCENTETPQDMVIQD